MDILLLLLLLAMFRHLLSLSALVQAQAREAIEVLVDMVDARDASTRQHSERVATYSCSIASAMGLEQGQIACITVSARLHDLGKVGIGDEWLYKTAPLTAEEWAQLQRHPALGADIVARFPALGVDPTLVRHHHEWWDGQGYPDRLNGEKIPLGARIICVADAFDAMTSDRPYRKALSYAQARRQLREHAGTQFDPTVVDLALPVLPGAAEENASSPLQGNDGDSSSNQQIFNSPLTFNQ
ncbi:MAG: HD-GYP domain-containing protein [Chloroflexota bacterium]|nr:HD-GYP domain-containing protein [Chloroflexota bacterium]